MFHAVDLSPTRVRSEKTALIYEVESRTFAELAEEVRRVVGGLTAQGVGVGSHVDVMVRNRPDFVIIQQPVFALGSILTPLSAAYRCSDLAHVISSCDLEYFVIDQEFVGHLPDVALLEALHKIFAFGLRRQEGELCSADDLDLRGAVLTGAAPVPAALLDRIYEVMRRDTTMMTAYGLTEASILVTLEHAELDGAERLCRPKSIDSVLPGMDVHIVDAHGRDAELRDVRAICIRGPNVMQDYYRRSDETAQTIRDGWPLSDDLGYFDAEGYRYNTGRDKNVIIHGDQSIYLAEIEEVIYYVPGVREVAVIGQLDETLGEFPVDYVAVDASSELKPEDLIERCKSEFAYFKVPVTVHFLSELPKGPTGKILRRALKSAEDLSLNRGCMEVSREF